MLKRKLKAGVYSLLLVLVIMLINSGGGGLG